MPLAACTVLHFIALSYDSKVKVALSIKDARQLYLSRPCSFEVSSNVVALGTLLCPHHNAFGDASCMNRMVTIGRPIRCPVLARAYIALN